MYLMEYLLFYYRTYRQTVQCSRKTHGYTPSPCISVEPVIMFSVSRRLSEDF